MTTSVETNMIFTTSDLIGLQYEDDKKKGTCSFDKINVDFLKLEIADIVPKIKTNTDQIIVRNGRKSNSEKNTKLF